MSFAIRMSKGQSRYGNSLVAYILILRKRKAETKKIRYMATGNIGVTTANIFPVIKKFLYSDHEIFLREIVSNAVDATSKLKTLASVGEFSGELGDLKVRVKIDKEAGTLTVSDSGIGMTADEIEKYINQIAFSGAEEFVEKYKNNANAIIGHFGLGFYSSFMVSKSVDIITLSYKDGSKAMKWSCNGDTEYTLEETTKERRGTDIVMHIDDENKEFLEENKISELLNKYCKFLPVEIAFGKETEWKDGKSVETDKDKIINNPSPAWTKKPADLKDEDYTNFYRELYPMGDDPLFHIHLNVDYPFNLTGILYFPKIKNNFQIQKNKIQLYCNQVFVTDSVEGIVPEFLTLLHGVIDSPDIPLNVSRSYLQSDQNVKKISSHITKKVADRLQELFNADRADFESKWDSLKIFIEYGMLTEEKFEEKARKFVLLKNVDDKYYTLEEYSKLVEANQKDKNDSVVYLYATDKEAQYSFIQKAKDKGYDVLMMDGELDSHFMSMLEHKSEGGKLRFARVDADTIDKLIPKGDEKKVEMSQEDQTALTTAFQSILPKNDKFNFIVSYVNADADSQAVEITQNEFMRRMKEMSRNQPGMNFYGDMPDSYNFVVNENSGLISKILRELKDKTASGLSGVLTEIRELEDNISNLRNQKDSDGKIKPEAQSTIKECETRLTEKQATRDAAYSSFAAESDEMKQLVDLSLLSVGLLKGSALDNFISRSMKML